MVSLLNKFFSLLFCLTLLFLNSCTEKKPDPIKVNYSTITQCALNARWCKSLNKHDSIAVQFPNKIEYLKTFQVKVKTTIKNIKKLQIQFAMKNMQMTKNSFILQKNTESKKAYWVTDIILPMCISGRHDWLVTVVASVDDQYVERFFKIKIVK
ncbi:hypothetical protein MNBD_GAMMA22-1437 [hydrothermal vent metagenome]|uniref:Uncharacterized protein n=1 Tax=hydrothermal vent metagenome TaxID=652676 RepID=A0A3B1B237_9ZZZZ